MELHTATVMYTFMAYRRTLYCDIEVPRQKNSSDLFLETGSQRHSESSVRLEIWRRYSGYQCFNQRNVKSQFIISTYSIPISNLLSRPTFVDISTFFDDGESF